MLYIRPRLRWHAGDVGALGLQEKLRPRSEGRQSVKPGAAQERLTAAAAHSAWLASAVGLRWVSIHFSFPYTLHVWAFRWLTPTAALRTQGLASPGKLRTGGTGKSLCCLAYLVLIFCLPYQNTSSVKQRLGHFWCILNTQNSSWNSADTHKSSYRVSEWVSGGTPALGFLGVLGPCKAKGHPSS